MIELFFFLTYVLMHGVAAQSCDCHQINNWNELKALISTKTLASSSNSSKQLDLPLCPFSFSKYHDQSTQHWSEIIYISSPIHIYCKKENPTDTCAITVTGDACRDNQNCGRQLFKIMSDGVWLQGLTIFKAKDVVVNVDKEKRNIKLIDMKFVDNEVPMNDTPLSPGVVSVELDASLEVLHSTFNWNKATPIYNRGILIVHDSYFKGNTGTKYFGKGGAILSKGETVVSKSSFLYNWGGTGGYSLFSNNDSFLDAGGNCFKSKNDWGCQGIMIGDNCFPFTGVNISCDEE